MRSRAADPERRRHAEAALGDAAPHLVREHRGRRERRAGADDRELVAAGTRQQVAFAHARVAHQLRASAQRFVAGRVALVVVDALEVVVVECNHAHRIRFADAVERVRQPRDHVRLVVRAGERVRDSLLVQRLGELDVEQRIDVLEDAVADPNEMPLGQRRAIADAQSVHERSVRRGEILDRHAVRRPHHLCVNPAHRPLAKPDVALRTPADELPPDSKTKDLPLDVAAHRDQRRLRRHRSGERVFAAGDKVEQDLRRVPAAARVF